jgi:type IV pilus assembly protein PilW
MQVMSVFEAQRRTTTGSADAQTNGGIALYAISRDLQMAGYGLIPATDSALECSTVNNNPGATGITLAPFSVTDGVASSGVDASDQITIRYGTSQMGGVPSQVNVVGGNALTVTTNLGCAANDIAVAISGSTCTLGKVTAVSAPGVNPTVTLQDATNVTVGANLACVGSWTEVTYYVKQPDMNLYRKVVTNGTTISDAPAIVGVVNLQVQYGISATTNNNQITQWVEPSGATWGAPSVANRNRIKAIRVAVIARNAKKEPDVVTAACSSVSSTNPAGLCAWPATVTFDGNTWNAPAVDLGPGDTDWAKYRYRVFETIVPMRNVIWAKDTL